MACTDPRGLAPSLAALTEAIEAMPSPWRDLAHLANSYLATGQLELAEAVFVQVARLAEPAAPAWAGALLCALCRGQQQQAALYRQLLEATDPAGRLAPRNRRPGRGSCPGP